VSNDAQWEAVLQRATQLCSKAGAELTELREQALSILYAQNRAIGAYELAKLCGRDPANVPSLYRVLKFWCGLGVVTQLPANNTYVLTELHTQTEATIVFVCSRCGSVMQRGDKATLRALRRVADLAKFEPDWQAVEINGACSKCSHS
jgi:Fur family zinc uptake transcriptional regulator